MKRRAILPGVLAVSLACGACGKKEDSLSLLVWEGYSDDNAVHDFEISHNCKIHSSFMGSSSVEANPSSNPNRTSELNDVRDSFWA